MGNRKRPNIFERMRITTPDAEIAPRRRAPRASGAPAAPQASAAPYAPEDMNRDEARRAIEMMDTSALSVADLPTRPVARVAVASAPARPAAPDSARAGKAVATGVRRAPRVVATIGTLVLLVLVNVVLQMDRRAWDIRSDGYWSLERVQRCESLTMKPDVLFLGSSRVVYGVDARLVDTLAGQQLGRTVVSCNAGMFGSSFEQDYYTLKRFIEDGFVPKVLVEDLREYNLNAGAAIPADASFLPVYQALPLADLSDAKALSTHFGGKGLLHMGDFIAGKLIPLYGDRIGLLEAICGSSQAGPCSQIPPPGAGDLAVSRYKAADANGWVPLNMGISIASLTPAQRQTRAAELQEIEGAQVANFTIGGAQPGYLAKLIALAQAHGIRVEMVVSPLHKTFFDLFQRPTDWPMIISYYQQFAAEHGATFYDESHPTGYTDADWYDAEHLTAAGAAKYAAFLAGSVVAPALR
ncbi:MAG: hypothetical protein OJF49_002037 [Ktedonobacterales bacterium]|jgi:hypothetical protein|nr:MAG: hypothetical protein OJF49_002037 [Ktedonobacterales bacterium]